MTAFIGGGIIDGMKTDEMKKTTLRLSSAKMKDLKRFCLDNDISVQTFLERAADYFMEKGKAPPEAVPGPRKGAMPLS